MAAISFQFNPSVFDGIRRFPRRITARALWLGMILLVALVAFELFNFATTEYALLDLFGAQDALGIATWAKVLAVAFCGIDFAGLSRLFTPEKGRKEPKEIWLLTGAWFLGGAMNAIMTWWAIGSALAANPVLGNELMSRADILHYGPIFIAGLVWLTRILIIGTFAFAGDHMFASGGRVAHNQIIETAARPVRAVPKAQYTPEPTHLNERQTRALPNSTAPAPTRESRAEGARRRFMERGKEQQEPAPPRSEPAYVSNDKSAKPRKAWQNPAASNKPRPLSRIANNGRASNTRTVPVRSQPAYEKKSQPQAASPLELEYVDFD